MSVSSRRARSLFVVLAVLLGVAFGVWLVLPPADIDVYARGVPSSWAKLQQVRAEAPRQRVHHVFVPLNSISADLGLAVIVGEDADFFGHGPWDFGAIHEAIDDWWQHGGALRGASTLTQQLAKNLYLSGDRSWWRKLREARYAYWLDDRLGKRRILELYLNVVELGDGVFGAEAGAQHYFGVHASDLSSDQAAELAACIPSPLRHNPATRTAAWRGRLRAIRERMQHFDWIRDKVAWGDAAAHQERRENARTVAPTDTAPAPALASPEGLQESEKSAPDEPAQLPPPAGAGAGAASGAGAGAAGTADVF